MKNSFKQTLIAVAIAALAAGSAMAATGDILVGFKGGATDFVIDVGPFSSLAPGVSSWNIGANLGTSFGAIGDLDGGFGIFMTYGGLQLDLQNNTGNLFGGDANSAAQTLGAGLTLNGTRSQPATDTTSWTTTSGRVANEMLAEPNAAAGSQAFLYAVPAGGTVTGGDTFFAYDASSGVLSYSVTPVPEPSTGSLLAGFGVLALLFRRQVVKA